MVSILLLPLALAASAPTMTVPVANTVQAISTAKMLIQTDPMLTMVRTTIPPVPMSASTAVFVMPPVKAITAAMVGSFRRAPAVVRAKPAAPVVTTKTEPAVVQSKPAAPVVMVVTFSTLPAPWGCIAHYESTSNLTAVNYKSGTEGAFQFDPATWTEFAPAGFPPSPLDATLGQQLTVAEIVLAHRGWGQWETAPLCGV
jgi:hypothetical protein